MLVTRVLAFYSHDLSSHPTGICSFWYCRIVRKEQKWNKTDQGLAFLKHFLLRTSYYLSREVFSDLSLAVVRCLVIMLQSFLQQGKQWPTLVAQAQVDILEILNFKKENHRALPLSLSLSPCVDLLKFNICLQMPSQKTNLIEDNIYY